VVRYPLGRPPTQLRQLLLHYIVCTVHTVGNLYRIIVLCVFRVYLWPEQWNWIRSSVSRNCRSGRRRDGQRRWRTHRIVTRVTRAFLLCIPASMKWKRFDRVIMTFSAFLRTRLVHNYRYTVYCQNPCRALRFFDIRTPSKWYNNWFSRETSYKTGMLGNNIYIIYNVYILYNNCHNSSVINMTYIIGTAGNVIYSAWLEEREWTSTKCSNIYSIPLYFFFELGFIRAVLYLVLFW